MNKEEYIYIYILYNMASITNNAEEKKSNVPMGNEEHVEKIHRIQTKMKKLLQLYQVIIKYNEYYQWY